MVIITASEILSFSVFLLFVLIIGQSIIRDWIRQSRCKHDKGVNETSSCDAICRKCGKNLGFIGNWRNIQ